jgi:hypothetical protein
VGFSNYLGITSTAATSVGSGDYFWIGQAIEGFNTSDLAWGTANAKTVTLSFQVYSSLTGTFGGSLYNSASNYFYPFSYTVSSANTWTSISVTIAGPTSGTWVGATNGIGMRVLFNLGAGSTYSGSAGAWASGTAYAPTGAVQVVATSGATFYITGVQLEKGTTATSFDYRPYGTELALCQRYYQQVNTPSSGSAYAGSGSSISATQFEMFVPTIVAMRTSPTFAYSGAGITDGATYGPSITSISGMGASTTGFRLEGACSAGGMTSFRPGFVFLASGYISFSAEL